MRPFPLLVASMALLAWTPRSGGEEAAIPRVVIDIHIEGLQSPDENRRERTFAELKGKPAELKAVVARLEKAAEEAFQAYRAGPFLKARGELVQKVRQDYEAHAAQKKVVGKQFVTAENKPEFLKLVELHQTYFSGLKSVLAGQQPEERRLTGLRAAVTALRAAGGLPPAALPDVVQIIQEALPDDVRPFLQEQDRYWAKVRQVYLWNRDHTPFAKDYHREAIRVNNDYRLIHGLLPVELEECLLRAATKHCEEMAELKYFAHVSPREENKTWDKRIRNEGYKGSPASENLACAGSATPATYAVRSFMQWLWDPHHHPLVNPGINQVGVGLVGGLAGGSYGSSRQWLSANLDPAPLPFAALEIDYAVFKRVFSAAGGAGGRTKR